MQAQTVLILFIIFVIAWMLFVLFYHAKKKENQQKHDPYHIDTDHWVKGKGISIGYSGDTRYINNREIKTPDEWTEWSVIRGFAMSISGHLKDLERKMLDGRCENYAVAKSEWHTFYERLRKLCIQHCLWNPMLDDHEIFKPTKSQTEAEQQLFQRIDAACISGVDIDYQRRSRKDKILCYMQSQNGQSVVRKTMVNHLCGTDVEEKKQYRKICNELVASGILTESHDEKNQLTIKLKRQYKKTAKEPTQLSPSVFIRTKYENLSPKMQYKVKHTVGTPTNIDRENNRCEFVSLSTGERYYTSLSQCTCPAYCGNEPCKHMVALAKHLGHL